MKHAVTSLAALALAGCAAQAEQAAAPALSKEALATQIGEKPTAVSPPTGQQWLYGSAEGAIASAQVYKTVALYVRAKALDRSLKTQVVLSQGSGPDARHAAGGHVFVDAAALAAGQGFHVSHPQHGCRCRALGNCMHVRLRVRTAEDFRRHGSHYCRAEFGA